MKKPYAIRYKDGEERFSIKDIEAQGDRVSFRDFAENIDSLAAKGGTLPRNTHYDKLEAVTVESIPPSDIDIVIYKGTWGQIALKCHDTIVIPPGCDHEAENVTDFPVWLLITNFTVED